MYPVVFFDALRVKIRDEGVVRNKAIYLALAILPDGTRDNLGLWIEQTEGAKFWMKVFSDRLVNPADPLKSLPGSSVARRYRHHALGRGAMLAGSYSHCRLFCFWEIKVFTHKASDDRERTDYDAAKRRLGKAAMSAGRVGAVTHPRP